MFEVALVSNNTFVTLISVQYGRIMHSHWGIVIRPLDQSTHFQQFLYYSDTLEETIMPHALSSYMYMIHET